MATLDGIKRFCHDARMIRLRHLGIFAGIFILVTTLSYELPQQIPLLQAPQVLLNDVVETFRPATRQDTSDDVLIVTTSYEMYDREELAKVIEGLAELQHPVKALGIDLFFDLHSDPGKDRRLERALKTFYNKDIKVIVAERTPDTNNPKFWATDNFLKETRARWGDVRFDTSHGVVRELPLRNKTQMFSVLLAEQAGANPPERSINIAYRTTEDGQAFTEISIDSLIKSFSTGLPKKLGQRLKDKIVLIGLTSNNTIKKEDWHPVPPWVRYDPGFSGTSHSATSGNMMPGVVIHAHIIDQLLEGRHVLQLPPKIEWLVIAVLSLLGILLSYWKGSRISKFIIAPCVLVLWWAVGLLLVQFSPQTPSLPLIWSSAAFAAAWGLSISYLEHLVRADRNFIHSQFDHYLDPKVVRTLLRQSDSLSELRSAKQKNMTFLFTDIEDFTGYSELLSPPSLVEKLNEYFDLVSEQILIHHGTIDKFVGDAVVAFFNAPSSRPDHAEQAVRCALAIQKVTETLREREGVAESPLNTFGPTLIGVHTGAAVVGSIGGEKRADYTVIGDSVNTASRLVGANKHFGTAICVSEATKELYSPAEFRPIADIVLKGRTQSLYVYEPLTAETRSWSSAYREAFELLDKQGPATDQKKIDTARDHFKALNEAHPDDPLVTFHWNRLTQGQMGHKIVLKAK